MVAEKTFYKLTFHTGAPSEKIYFVEANRKPTKDEARARLGYADWWEVEIEQLGDTPVLEWTLPNSN